MPQDCKGDNTAWIAAAYAHACSCHAPRQTLLCQIQQQGLRSQYLLYMAHHGVRLCSVVPWLISIRFFIFLPHHIAQTAVA